jgi:hypothetical protein
MQFTANFMTLPWCADLLLSLTIGFYGLAWLNYVSPNSYNSHKVNEWQAQELFKGKYHYLHIVKYHFIT